MIPVAEPETERCARPTDGDGTRPRKTHAGHLLRRHAMLRRHALRLPTERLQKIGPFRGLGLAHLILRRPTEDRQLLGGRWA